MTKLHTKEGLDNELMTLVDQQPGYVEAIKALIEYGEQNNFDNDEIWDSIKYYALPSYIIHLFETILKKSVVASMNGFHSDFMDYREQFIASILTNQAEALTKSDEGDI